MRFLSIYRPAKKTPGPPNADEMEKMGKFIEESFKSGELVATGGLMPGRTYVRSAGGQVNVVDGPFAESKELIAGFALLQADSKDGAIEMSRRFLRIAGDGECELHQIMEGTSDPPR